MAFRRLSRFGRAAFGAICVALLILLWNPSSPQLSATPGQTLDQTDNLRPTPNGPVYVSGIKVRSGQAGGAYIDVATSGKAQYHVSKLDNPSRLVVDVEGIRANDLHSSYSSPSPLLKKVRVGQFRSDDPPIVRVVADLDGNPSTEVHVTSNGLRIELKSLDFAQHNIPMIQPVAAQQTIPQAAPGATQAAPPPVAPVARSASPNSFFTNSPFRTLMQNQKLLDTLGIRIVLNLNYRKGAPDEAAWKTKGLPGVVANRLFIKSLGGGNYQSVELAVMESPQGGFEIAAYGAQSLAGHEGPNSDFSDVQSFVNDEISKMAQAPPPTADLSQLNYEAYHLSYVTADRAMALLKTLGYSTVEYNEQAGDSLYDKLYNPVKLGTRPPFIVKLIDSTKTSLMEPAPSPAAVPGQPIVAQPQQQVGGFGGASSAVPQIGGTFLQGMTSGEPQQRLLILYDKNDPDSLQNLLNLLQNTIDVPSRQVMIEALVIELNADKTRDLGITFESVQNQADVANAGATDSSGNPVSIFNGTQDSKSNPLDIFIFTKGAIKQATFNAHLQALLLSKQAQILSNPSVLVLDDRQARIQIGQQVPVQQTTFTGGGVGGTGFSYFPVGIVLNLRPRISEDGSEVTMQTETIVSAINGGSVSAPVVDNRQVQSIVRVADNTPYIIGGLIATNDQTITSGIPLLSQIPGIGALFRSNKVDKQKTEVIIVITPHVIPVEEKYFSYVIPKDSSLFDRPDYKLYRNAYRIRGEDLFDLEFIQDSNVYKQLVNRVKDASTREPELKKTEPFASVLNGGAPGEDILVRRLLWGIIHRTGYEHYVTPDQMIFFRENPSAVGGTGFDIDFLAQELKKAKGDENTLAMTFEANPQGTADRSFVPPKARLSFENLTIQDYMGSLLSGNATNPDGTQKNWQILLNKEKVPGVLGATPIEVLQGAVVLKRVLELNPDLPLKLNEFRTGRQIIFPSQEELTSRYHQVDREVARLFYEIYNYYPAFEQEFNRQTRKMNGELDKIDHGQ